MTQVKKFASQADLEEKQVTFTSSRTTPRRTPPRAIPTPASSSATTPCWWPTPRPRPRWRQDVIRRIREVTDKPIKYVVLTHYHAVRVLGASAYRPQQIIASQDTYDLIVERGEQDKASEIGRFPRLFRDVETVPPA